MKRRLIYCPDVCGRSAVLLFEKGEGGKSWSIRDYSGHGAVSVRYAREFGMSLQQLKERTVYSADAPVVSVNDLAFWHALTNETNSQLGISGSSLPETRTARSQHTETCDPIPAEFEILDRERLMALRKARKVEDMRRILHSPNSEDWVTWNAFAIVQRLAPEEWWRHLVDLAKAENPLLSMPDGWHEKPTVTLWRCVPSPSGYESASRARMRDSAVSDWVARSENPGPVEGDSEIDISIHNSVLTLFVEAKLGSDISLRTTYDPDRNQIARNIDCLLDDARGTMPMFWMLVRDSGDGRGYRQIIDLYRHDPTRLAANLPHRDPTVLAQVAQRISIVLWKDFISAVQSQVIEDELITMVLRELQSRAQ